MYEIEIHKHVQKTLKKSPEKIKKRAFLCLSHLQKHGTKNFPYSLAILRGYKKFTYIEAKIDKDFRIVFRLEGRRFFVRYAGTHNSLGTG